MKKLYSLMLIVLMAVFAANASSVSFTNPNGWTKVNAYWWGGTGETCAWPGKAMTKSGDVWTIDITGTPANIIFNNGSAQTGDLVFTDGATYDMNGVVGVENPTFTVNFDNSTAKWAKVYCYTYNGVCTGGWPGTEMTKGADNIYTISFQAAVAPKNVIFSNGSGAQTSDLDFEDGATYNQSGVVGDEPTPGTDITIYWNNATAKWATPTIHYWGAASSSWPGVAMTKVEGTANIWKYVCPAGTKQILFNAGDGDATKTGDFDAIDNHIYDQTGDQGEYTGEEPDPTPETLQFFGNVNGAGWKLADLVDGAYTFEVTAESYFTFTTTGNWEGAWRPESGADTKLQENGTVQAKTSGNGTFIISIAGTYTVTPNADDTTFEITGFTGDIPEPQPEKLQILIYMEGTEGAAWETKDLDENGSYTFDSTNDIDALFTFTTSGNWDKAWHPMSNIDLLIQENGTYEAIVNDGASHNNGIFKITAPGTFVVTPDEATTSFTVTGFNDNNDLPENVYIIGYINGNDFSTINEGMQQTTAEDGVYTFKDALIGDAGAGLGYINIATVLDTESTGNWDATVNSGNRYGAPVADTPLAVGTPADVKVYKAGVDASACQSWAVAPGKYDVTLDLNTMKISLTAATTGIEAVDMEGGVAPAYYNLQGVRVMNPENGIFIEVRGNKAVKVVK